MKKIFFLLPILMFWSCGEDTPKVAKANTTYEMEISGMTCETGCKKLIEKKMSQKEGVVAFAIDFEKSLATVVFDENILDTTALRENVSEINNGAYSARGLPQTYRKL
ncbi:MAG: heavy-metal-associated domain-containing protein [Cryomorphaceae bacterium]|nr:heavy-metal-associated domain-containing protein [Cryomorphaceae bacterium]